MKLMRLKNNILFFAVLLLIESGCRKEAAVPKPKGYFRIDLPEKEYVSLNTKEGIPDLPFSFEIPVYGNINFGSGSPEEEGWFNIEFPAYKAIIYLTYKPLKNDFAAIMEQTYRMNVKNHITRADAIKQLEFNNEDAKVYGILYDLKGNAATAVQFYATDSVRHYMRGSLYFDAEPNADSLAPVIDFLREDIKHLVETLNWDL